MLESITLKSDQGMISDTPPTQFLEALRRPLTRSMTLILLCSSMRVHRQITPLSLSYINDHYIHGYRGCLRKKYRVTCRYQYFKNGKTQDCHILRRNKYSFCLVGYEKKF